MGLASDTPARYDIAPAAGYAGDVSPRTAWQMLQDISESVLVDVRTTAEWAYVGAPDLRAIGKSAVALEWQVFPAMQIDSDFAAKLSARLTADREAPLLMLCRSGARSASAAKAMTAAGYRRCFNVADGFEGPLDAAGHRGGTSGWKANGLPWSQK
ncbi:MAG TPA: rhodanese-like domain-containing protein [Vineibacter sp.]|nr:rhodanese-like domain-containing protein [Vineibacter sp.]